MITVLLTPEEFDLVAILLKKADPSNVFTPTGLIERMNTGLKDWQVKQAEVNKKIKK